MSQGEYFPMTTPIQDLDAALCDEAAERAPGRYKLRGRDVPTVAGTANEAPSVDDASNVVRSQPVAAAEDLDNRPPQRERPARETCSAPKARLHGHIRRLGNCNFENPEYAEMAQRLASRWMKPFERYFGFFGGFPPALPLPWPWVRGFDLGCGNSGQRSRPHRRPFHEGGCR
jgi:hypothetical protein